MQTLTNNFSRTESKLVCRLVVQVAIGSKKAPIQDFLGLSRILPCKQRIHFRDVSWRAKSSQKFIF